MQNASEFQQVSVQRLAHNDNGLPTGKLPLRFLSEEFALASGKGSEKHAIGHAHSTAAWCSIAGMLQNTLAEDRLRQSEQALAIAF